MKGVKAIPTLLGTCIPLSLFRLFLFSHCKKKECLIRKKSLRSLSRSSWFCLRKPLDEREVLASLKSEVLLETKPR